MVNIRYTYWDGSQKLKLDADKVFEKLAEFLSYSDDIRQAMDWMMRQGMDFDGVKVQGLEEFLEQLRQEMRQRYRDFNLKNSLSELEQKLDQILDQERQTLDSMRGQKDGVEDKERQLQQMPRRLSEALRKLESYDFEDAQAKADFDDLLIRVREYPRPREFSRPLQSHVPWPREPRLREIARPDARDGADASTRTGPDVRATSRASRWRT